MVRANDYSLQGQLERTVLSWNRSSLAIGANGGLLAREGFERGITGFVAGGLAVVAIAIVIWAASSLSYLPAREHKATHLLARRQWPVVSITILAVILACADLALTITGP